MGARPQAVVMALSAPGSCEAETLEGIGRGLAQRCGRHDVSVVGGDLGAADELSLTVTALGSLPEGQPPIRRSGARDGDVLAIGSTQLGRSAGGLAWVLSGARIGQELPAGVADLIAWHQAPDPDLTLGWTRAPGTATAMLDLSDGLVRDGTRLAQASGAVADLDPSVLAADVAALEPVATALDARGDARSAHELAWSWVLHGGEEHAMLATFPPDRLPEGFRRIGRIRAPEARENPRVLLGGELVPVGGFDHFA
jgi:thiamine-monophosphate kinase